MRVFSSLRYTASNAVPPVSWIPPKVGCTPCLLESAKLRVQVISVLCLTNPSNLGRFISIYIYIYTYICVHCLISELQNTLGQSNHTNWAAVSLIVYSGLSQSYSGVLYLYLIACFSF